MLVYPAIFYKAIEGGYVVMFPDFNNGGTQGETLDEAMEMSQDYIGTWLYDDYIQGKELLFKILFRAFLTFLDIISIIIL